MSGYSVDLRERIVAASAAGHTQAWIAATFAVSVSSIKRYLTRQRQTGSVAATRPVHPAGQLHNGWREALLSMVADDNSRTLAEYCDEWQRHTGMVVSVPTLCRAFARFGITRKKTVGASERNEAARREWQERAETLPARRVVVIDESSTHLDMARVYGRALRGQRAFGKQKRNDGQNVTLLAGLRLDGMTAPMVIEGAVTIPVFDAYVRQVLLPTLQRGDIVVLDNLAAHKSNAVRALLAAKGIRLLFLPPYSPDFSPIENAFAKLKAFLRRARAQTFDALVAALASALDTISPCDAIGFFTHAGFLNLDD